MMFQYKKPKDRKGKYPSAYRTLLGLAILAFAGCSPNVSVKGKVSFEDGSPLDIGVIVFQSSTHVGKGRIASDGAFSVGSVKPNDGLPPGSYKVFIIEAGRVPPGFVPDPESDESGIVSLIDPRYCDPATTPIHYDIEKKSDLEITVQPYHSKPVSRRR